MGLTLKLDDIKPLLGAVGLGQDPAPAPKDVSSIATPPMPPPPTPAQAGFSLWSADPKNQQTVANSLTMPGTPITPPNTPPSSPLSASPTPPPPDPNIKPLGSPQFAPLAGMNSAPPDVGASTPNFSQQTKMNADIANNPSQYQQPGLVGQGWKGLLRFGLPAALMSAGSGLSNMGRGDPTAGFKLLGDQVAHDQGIPAANAAQYDLRNVKPLRDAAALADTQSQTAQRNAAAAKSNQQADDLTPLALTKEQASAINQPTLEGTAMTPRDYNQLVGLAGNNNTSSGNNAANNATKAANNAANNVRAKAIADAANKTKTLLQGMRDNTSRANNENTNNHKGMNGGDTGPDGMPIGNFKVPSVITNRASLASNVLENAKRVSELAQQLGSDRLGAVGGRYTNIQQMIGSDDHDIQELGTRIHNIALASNGAHGTKGKGVLEDTEMKIYNNFKNGPHGVQGALDGITGSMQSFLDDEKNFQNSGRRTSGSTPLPTGGATPTHRFNAATGKIEAISK